MPRGLRIHAVRPGILEESMGEIGAFFSWSCAVPGWSLALAYSKSMEGRLIGQVCAVL